MTLEETLLSVPFNQWRVGQVYSYGWYDGPRDGGCRLVTPACEFYFELIDERYNPDGLDDRLYRLSEIPLGSVAEMEKLSHQWRNSDPAISQEATRRLDAIRAARRPTDLVVYSTYMNEFLGCWRVDPAQTDVKDWFTFLGIPAQDSSGSPHGQVA
jgi:hypothetical protein